MGTWIHCTTQRRCAKPLRGSLTVAHARALYASTCAHVLWGDGPRRWQQQGKTTTLVAKNERGRGEVRKWHSHSLMVVQMSTTHH